jgi:hypothetical protein
MNLVLWLYQVLLFKFIFRQQSKEGLAKSASNITENLMSIAKMMESQVQQSRNNTEVLSKCILSLKVINSLFA